MIITDKDLVAIRAKHVDQKLVLTSGTFDLFHVGHLHYLEAVKACGDVVVVLLSGDARVQARKGPERPIISEVERAEILNALKIVDYVFIDQATASPDQVDPIHAEILAQLEPDFYVTDGPDPRFVELMKPEQFVILPRANELPSTSAIIDRIRNLT